MTTPEAVREQIDAITLMLHEETTKGDKSEKSAARIMRLVIPAFLEAIYAEVQRGDCTFGGILSGVGMSCSRIIPLAINLVEDLSDEPLPPEVIDRMCETLELSIREGIERLRKPQ